MKINSSTRTYGLTCDHLTAAQVVPADGTMITCDDSSNQNLYWALRGAGAVIKVDLADTAALVATGVDGVLADHGLQLLWCQH